MLTQLTDRETIRRYLRALRREQLLARVQRDEERIERLLPAHTIAVDAAPDADYYSASAAPLGYMLSLLDEPHLRDRVSAISIDLPSLHWRRSSAWRESVIPRVRGLLVVASRLPRPL
jgi:hypothetical protein